MASDDIYALKADEYADFVKMRAEFSRRSQGGPANGLGERLPSHKPPIIVALMDALNSGQTVLGRVLQLRSRNTIQTITTYGSEPVGYFKVGFREKTGDALQWTPNFYPAVDPPETLKKYLADLNGVGYPNVAVTWGLQTTHDRVQHNMWRWQVVFAGKFSGKTLPMLQIEAHLTGAALLVTATNPLEDTGRFEEIFCPVPVSTPTPLRTGAIAMASWVPDCAAYCIHACEVRDYGDYGLF